MMKMNKLAFFIGDDVVITLLRELGAKCLNVFINRNTKMSVCKDLYCE